MEIEEERLIPYVNPVEFVLDEEIPDGEVRRPERQNGEPFRFIMSSKTASTCWADMKAMKEAIEFLVKAFGRPSNVTELRSQNQT